MTRRILSLLLCTVMVLSMIPVVAMVVSAEDEGMWTTYQSASAYEITDGTRPPESGYGYTDEGLTIVQPDWTGETPFVTVSSKETINLKEDGLYLEFRVDEFSYGGTYHDKDHWIALTLNTGKVEADGTVSGKVDPGNCAYGGGWLTLLRYKDASTMTTMPHVTRPATEGTNGTFENLGMSFLNPSKDDWGRRTFTFEVRWDGSAYVIKVNGYAQVCNDIATQVLESLSADGEFFVGISLYDAAVGKPAGLTITKFGTSAEDATMPRGSDSKAPETTTEPETTAAPETTAEPETTAAPETTTEPETTAEPETTGAPETTAEPETTAAPETTIEPETTVAPETTAEPETTATPETTAEPETTVVPETTIEPETTAAPETTAEPETTAAPETTAEPETTKAKGCGGVIGWSGMASVTVLAACSLTKRRKEE